LHVFYFRCKIHFNGYSIALDKLPQRGTINGLAAKSSVKAMSRVCGIGVWRLANVAQSALCNIALSKLNSFDELIHVPEILHPTVT
jgi:hypothetical protein